MGETGFEHPIGRLVLDQLRPGVGTLLAFDEAGVRAIHAALAEALRGGEGDAAFRTLFVVSGMLLEQEAIPAAEVVQQIALSLAAAARAAGVDVESVIAKVEAARGQYAKLIDQKPSTAPREGETTKSALLGALGKLKDFK